MIVKEIFKKLNIDSREYELRTTGIHKTGAAPNNFEKWYIRGQRSCVASGVLNRGKGCFKHNSHPPQESGGRDGDGRHFIS